MDALRPADEEMWQCKLARYQRTLWEPYDSVHPLRLYHYSRTAGIRGILESRKIWVSDVRGMKADPRDGTYWLEVFRPIITQHRCVPDRVKNLFRTSRDFGLGQFYHVFVTCFSARDDLGHQWESFAERGSGCAIEVDYNALFAGAAGGKSYGIARLLYDKTEQERMARLLVQKPVERACLVPQADRDRYWERCATFEFLVCGQRFKRSCYSKEDEWRLLIASIDTANLQQRNDGTPYTPHPLTPDLVTGVVKGPKCVTPDEVIREWLVQGAYPGVVRQCPVPFQ